MFTVFNAMQDLDRSLATMLDGPLAFRPTAMDAVREDDAVHLTLDLPGVDPSTIDVQSHGRTITIRAERPVVAVKDAAAWLLRERPTGTIMRQVRLGFDIDTEKIIALYDNGVLSVTVPFAASSAVKKISVLTGQTAAKEIAA